MPEPRRSTAPQIDRERYRSIEVIDAHTAGEPLRVIVGGYPEPQGDTIVAKRRDLHANHDALRTAIMWEPRGHADMYGCLPTAPVTPDGDMGVLFLHNEGYSTMCGHGIIGLVTVAIECGMIEAKSTIRLDTPAGRVTAAPHMKGDRVTSVSFENVASFVADQACTVDVADLGTDNRGTSRTVRYDLCFGGAFYAVCDSEPLGLDLDATDYRTAIDYGTRIKQAIMNQRTIDHPVEPDLGFLYGVIFVGPAQNRAHHSRNVCVFADGEVDRSPTGTGVSARAALHHARGELALGKPIVIESILGTTFTVTAQRATTFGSYPAIVPVVEGSASITGHATLLIDPDDALGGGFMLR